MTLLSSSSKLLLRFLVIELALFLLFTLSYFEYFKSTGFNNPLFYVPLTLLGLGFLYLLFMIFKMRGALVDNHYIRFHSIKIPWHSVKLVSFVKSEGSSLFLAIHSSTNKIIIPGSSAKLLSPLLRSFAPDQWKKSLVFPSESPQEINDLEEHVLLLGKKLLLPLALFSLGWALWVWQVVLLWAIIWSSVALVIPMIGLNFTLGVISLLKKSELKRVLWAVQFMVYLFGFLYLWYGIYFVGNVLG